MFENVMELGKYVLEKSKSLEFRIPHLTISRNDDSKVRERIKSIGPRERN